MKNVFFALIAFVMLALQSCSVDTETHFNKDWSGHTENKIDISQMMAFAQGMADENEDSPGLSEMMSLLNKQNRPDSVQNVIDSLGQELSKKGVKNFDIFTEDNGAIGMEFDFKNVEVLNEGNMMSVLDSFGGDNIDNEELDMMNGMDGTTVNYKVVGKKKLIIDLAGGQTYDAMLEDMMQPDPEDPEDEGMSKEEAEMALEMSMGMMSSMMTINNTYTFDRKIKNVESALPVKYKKNGKELKVNYDLGAFMEALKNDNEAKVIVTLK